MDRFEYERAIQASDLPSLARWVAQVLVTKADWPSGVVPTEYTPSLTRLERDTGLSRSALKVNLNRAEEGGWIRRDRPTIEAARSKKERTQYSLLLPEVSRPSESPEASEEARPSESLGRETAQARPSESPELGRETAQARPSESLNQIFSQTYPDPSPDQDSDSPCSSGAEAEEPITGELIDPAGPFAPAPRRPSTLRDYHRPTAAERAAMQIGTPAAREPEPAKDALCRCRLPYVNERHHKTTHPLYHPFRGELAA